MVLVLWYLLGITLVGATPELKAEATSAFTTRSDITVTWSDIPNPSPKDYVALYSTGWLTSQHNDQYLKRLYNTKGTPQGTATFPAVWNTRWPFVVVYWGGGSTRVVSSNLVNPIADYPQQVHVAYTSISDELLVSWVVNSSTPARVSYGVSPTSLTHHSASTVASYTYDELKKCRATDTTALTHFFPPGSLHNAVLTGMLPATQYYYQITVGEHTSEVFNITMGPSKGSKDVRFIYWADAGIGPASPDEVGGELAFGGRNNDGPTAGTKLVLKAMIDLEGPHLNEYGFIVHSGDLAYACGVGIHWDIFMQLVQPLAARVPYFVSMGNHEYDHHSQPFRPPWADFDSDSGGECGIPYTRRFPRTPDPEAPWYSSDIGPVHLLVLSLEVNMLHNSTQAAFIDKDLSQVDRTATPWVVITHHRPMYGSKSSEATMHQHAQAELEPLYLKHKVDVVFSAHDHLYARMCPLREGKCVPFGKGPAHILDGCGGAYLEGETFPSYALAVSKEWGYTRVMVTMTQFTVEHVVLNGTVVDTVTYSK